MNRSSTCTSVAGRSVSGPLLMPGGAPGLGEGGEDLLLPPASVCCSSIGQPSGRGPGAPAAVVLGGALMVDLLMLLLLLLLKLLQAPLG